MKLLGIRYCDVNESAQAFAGFLDDLGLERTPFGDGGGGGFQGAVYPAGDSWIELWAASDGMPAGSMLQLVVDDADAFAAHARRNGLEIQGPTDAHGERIYFLKSPTGLNMSFQSKLDSA